MTDTKTEIAGEALTTIGGGSCTLRDAVELSDKLTDAYENLIEFTTYVMERVGGP